MQKKKKNKFLKRNKFFTNNLMGSLFFNFFAIHEYKSL